MDQPPIPGFSPAGSANHMAVAKGCRQPTDHAPCACTGQLEGEALPDAAISLPLTQSCKGGQEMLFRRAADVVFTLDVGLPADQLQRRASSVAQYVTERQPLPSGLLLSTNHTPFPAALQPWQGIADGPWPVPHQAAAPVEGAKVRRRDDARTCAAVLWFSAECARTIKRLTLTESVSPRDPALRFTLPSLAYLTQLSLSSPLTDEWLGVVLAHFPQLEQLSVPRLAVRTAAEVGNACQFARLVVRGPDHEAHINPPARRQFSLTQLRFVPLPSQGRPLHVQLPRGSYISVEAAWVHTPWVTKRMPRWRFEGLDSLSVHAYSQDQADYVTQGTLQVLTDMAPTVPVRKLTIANSCVDTALMSVIAPMWGWDVRLIECAVYDNPVTLFNQYTPCVTVLQLAPDYNGPVQLTDKVLQSLVEQCPCLKELTVCGVHLEASHAHRTVEHLRVLRVLEHPEQRESVWTHLERLPLPKHEPYYVQTETGVAAVLPPVVMSSTQVPDDACFEVPPSFHLCNKTTATQVYVSITAGITLTATDQPAALGAALAHVTNTHFSLRHVGLHGWLLTPALTHVVAQQTAQRPGLRVSMTETRCTWQTLSDVALPAVVTHLEITGLRGSGMGAAGTAAAGSSQQGQGATAGSQWVLYVRDLLPFVQRMDAACQLVLRDIEVVSNFKDSEETTMARTVVVKPLWREYVVYRLQCPRPGMTPAEQAQALVASCQALEQLQRPDVIVFSGWHVTAELLAAMPALWPSCAVVFGADVLWPAPGAADLCQQVAWRLPCSKVVEWVVHDTCGVLNLAHMLVGRDGMGGTVHVITDDTGFAPAVMEHAGALLARNQVINAEVRPCATMSQLRLPDPRAVLPEQHAADCKKQAVRWLSVFWQQESLNARLRAAADAADAAGCAAAAASARAEVAPPNAQARQVAGAFEHACALWSVGWVSWPGVCSLQMSDYTPPPDPHPSPKYKDSAPSYFQNKPDGTWGYLPQHNSQDTFQDSQDKVLSHGYAPQHTGHAPEAHGAPMPVSYGYPYCPAPVYVPMAPQYSPNYPGYWPRRRDTVSHCVPPGFDV